ncbi:solute carrier family 2, facilitated glucose transporter member 8-like [Portunus trituberculatus]|uniref:solute carrier family 2, facilitated glucose transporter member 8-like n=1 Tax=Portunus trituberculatus TaxID=210409 RepID=UPI001E1CCA2E|nr:solute carrier family 2, facilitated glucose transporter member 8-like [Portunus trituberculatus]
METPSATRRRIQKQVMKVSGICLGAINMGLMLVWPSVAFTDLQRKNTTIYGNSITLSDTQMDLIGSILPAGSFFGTLAGGYVVARIGRRRSMLWLTVPSILAWVILALSYSLIMILIGRFVNGLYCGVMVVVGSAYVVELPDTAVRGALAAFPTLFLQLGYIIVLVSGLGLRWYQISFVGIGTSIMTVVAMLFIPESPSYLIATGQESEAREVLTSLRGVHANIEDEINYLRTKNIDLEGLSFLKILKIPDIRKPLIMVLVLFFIHNFCGIQVFTTNMTRIFHESGTELDETTSTLIVFLTLLLGNTVSIFTINYIGRRNSLVISLTILVVSLVIFGSYAHNIDSEKAARVEEIMVNASPLLTSYSKNVKDESNLIELRPLCGKITSEIVTKASMHKRDESTFEELNETLMAKSFARRHTWVPVTCLLVFMAGASLGIAQVPFILNSEYFPTTIRAQASSICLMASNLLNVLALQLFTPIQAALTPAGFYWFTAGICTFGIIFSFAFIIETKDKAIG